MELVLFESSFLRENFGPLALTRPTFDFLVGKLTLKERIESKLSLKVTNLLVPKHLEALAKENNPVCNVNAHVASSCLLVNSLLRPRYDIFREVKNQIESHKNNFVVVDREKVPIFAVLENFEFKKPESLDFGKAARVPESSSKGAILLHYPWDLIAENAAAIESDYANIVEIIKEPSKALPKGGPEQLGSKIFVSENAEIERFVTLDSRAGPIIIDERSIVQSFSHLTGPCYVGKSSIVKSALIREGTTIGQDCRVGGEVEETIIHDYSNKNHSGFLGHSLVGSWVNMGAETTNSDLKNTYGTIKVEIGRKKVDTKSLKVGCFLSDMCKTSIGSLVFSGKFIGVCSGISGTVSKNVPSFAFRATSFPDREIVLESSIETERRMMSRRKIKMTEAYEAMLRAVFKMTAKERVLSGVRTGRLAI